jgi:protein SCO1/2
MKNKSYIGISFIILIFGIWAVPKIIAKFQKSDLVEIGPVPEFKLTNQKNKSISNKDYLGKVYVVEFFFATCPTICPKMNQSMLQLQDEFYGNPSFGLVSITIDPSNDTPQFLDEHARMLGVKHYNWNFLTGDKEYIFNLANKGFNLYAGENNKVAGGFEHSGLFALVDKEGKIRCRKDTQGNPILYYDGLDPKGVEAIKEDIKKLLVE